ncbi:MAG TPA: septum formation initiator family protein [Candidatus Acidoferrales bacterium]|jgi:cell division protein FtsB|nr:septum formation initiator family protein [Candidatus Acidoferrales bacterium]
MNIGAVTDRLQSWRTILASGGATVLAVALGFHVLFGTNGWMAYRQKKAEYQQLQREVEQLRKDNESVQQQINSLKSDPKAIERVAREQLRYAKPGEIIYVMPEARQAPAPPTQAQK